MFCTTCGMKNAAESNYCKQCGHQIDNTASPRVREEELDLSLPEDERLRVLLDRAYSARKAGDSALALSLCQEALVLRPDSATAHSMLGQLYETLGEREMAIRQYERVLRLNPGSIADRVKLDELRDGAMPMTRGSAPPHIVFADHMSRQSGSQIVAWVALGGVLMLIGGVLAQRLYSQPAPTATMPGVQVPASLAQGSRNASPANAGAAPSGGQSPVAANDAPKTAPTYNPYLFNMPPPIIVQPPPDNRVRSEQSSGNGTSGRIALAPVHLPGPSKTVRDSASRFVLPVDDSSDEKSAVVIQVENDKGKSKAPHTAPPGPGKMSMTIGSQQPTGGNDNVQGASYDARSYIAAGGEHRQSGDYDKALQSYTRALTSAGDDLASVYQQIARCHQLRGDKTSAVANYRNAIAEYHKLMDAKKQAEFAEDGIRVCEKAIKACNY